MHEPDVDALPPLNELEQRLAQPDAVDYVHGPALCSLL
jgi:hypothetical protein